MSWDSVKSASIKKMKEAKLSPMEEARKLARDAEERAKTKKTEKRYSSGAPLEAKGDALDKIGREVGMMRYPGEGDAEFKTRVLSLFKSVGADRIEVDREYHGDWGLEADTEPKVEPKSAESAWFLDELDKI